MAYLKHLEWHVENTWNGIFETLGMAYLKHLEWHI
jgi:uncharacterized protein HemY